MSSKRERPPMFDRVRDDVRRAMSGHRAGQARQERLEHRPPAETVIDPAPSSEINRKST
ncbi:hypothetical protein [Salinifilum ghardaiensis]